MVYRWQLEMPCARKNERELWAIANTRNEYTCILVRTLASLHQARSVGVARAAALQRRDLVMAGLDPRRILSDYQLSLVSEALGAEEKVDHFTMDSFVEGVLVSNVITNARDRMLTQEMLEAAGVKPFPHTCHLKLTSDILLKDNMILNSRNKLGDTALHKTVRGNAIK